METKEVTADQIKAMLDINHKGPFENSAHVVRLGAQGQRVHRPSPTIEPDITDVGSTGVAAEGFVFTTSIYTYNAPINPIITSVVTITPPPKSVFWIPLLAKLDYTFINGLTDTSKSPNAITTNVVGRILCEVSAQPNNILSCSMLFDAETGDPQPWTSSAKVFVLYF